MKLLIIAAFVSVLDEVITSLAQNTLRAKITLFPLENLTEMLPFVNKNSPNCSSVLGFGHFRSQKALHYVLVKVM